MYSDNCIAFIQGSWTNSECNYHPALFECVGLNKFGDILIKSQTIHCTSGYGWSRCGGPIMRMANQYHFNVIDEDKKGYITLKQWISSMKRLDICSDEILLKRIFYFINLDNNRKDAENQKITAQDLRRFCEGKFYKSGDYRQFICKLQENKQMRSTYDRWAK